MATLVLTAAGVAVGAMVGGPIGVALAVASAYAGSQIGSNVDRSLFGGNRRVEGPRLGDLTVQSSAYGQTVPLLYGTVRAAGNVIWSTGLIETRREESQKVSGGKGGGSTRVTNVTYLYSVSLAVALSARPIHSIRRVWADGKLLRDGMGRLAVDGLMRVYTGNEAQAPDPIIEAREGIGQAPAYRGLAYVVFENLALAEYANRIPNLTFEVIADDGGVVLLSTVVSDLTARADLAAVDVEGLAGTIHGYALSRSMTYVQALEFLAAVYAFDMVERDQKLYFKSLNRSAVATIDRNDLLRLERGTPLSIGRRQDIDLPREVVVRYIDKDRDYQLGLQRAKRSVTHGLSVLEQDMPLVSDATMAKRTAETLLARHWLERQTYSFALGMAHARLMQGDVVALKQDDRIIDSVLLVEADCNGSTIQFQGVSYSPHIYDSAAAADGGAVPPQVIPDLADTEVYLLNLPALSGSDLGVPHLYMAASSSTTEWRGATLFRSIDAGESYDWVTATSIPALAGVAITALGNGPVDYWDEGAGVVIELFNPSMTLEARTMLAVLNGANGALIGNEIIQFRNATMDGDGRYVLTGLLRGRRGTEHHVGSHGVGERFLLLEPSSLQSIPISFSAVGRTDFYKIVSSGDTLDTSPSIPFAVSAQNLKPFSPVHVQAIRHPNGDCKLHWIRRTRADGAWIDGADVSLAEENERYDVEIIDGSNVLRTMTTTGPEVLYSEAQQLTDHGVVPPSLTVRVYQVSAQVGRGSRAEAIV